MNTTGRIRKRSNPYAQVSNKVLRDKKLSLKAKGLYALIESYLSIDDWDLYKSHLMSLCKEGRDGFNAAWNELINEGYLIQYKMQDHKTKKFLYEYELSEENKPLENKRSTNGKARYGKAVYGKAVNGKAVSIYNTDIKNTDKTNTDITNSINLNKELIESNTNIVLSKNMINTVSLWDMERLKKSIDIYKSNSGKSFKFLNIIYSDDSNFINNKANTKTKKLLFKETCSSRNYTEEYYKELEDKLLYGE